MSREHGRGDRGFTLVEILVVLVFLGLILTIAFENLTMMKRKYDFQSSSRELMTFIRSVPGWAKTENAPVFLVWAPDSDRVAITADAAGTTTLDDFRIPDYLILTPSAALVYRCDTLGRAYADSSATMLGAPALLTTQYDEDAYGTIEPAVAYQITLTPAWFVDFVELRP